MADRVSLPPGKPSHRRDGGRTDAVSTRRVREDRPGLPESATAEDRRVTESCQIQRFQMSWNADAISCRVNFQRGLMKLPSTDWQPMCSNGHGGGEEDITDSRSCDGNFREE